MLPTNILFVVHVLLVERPGNSAISSHTGENVNGKPYPPVFHPASGTKLPQQTAGDATFHNT